MKCSLPPSHSLYSSCCQWLFSKAMNTFIADNQCHLPLPFQETQTQTHSDMHTHRPAHKRTPLPQKLKKSNKKDNQYLTFPNSGDLDFCFQYLIFNIISIFRIRRDRWLILLLPGIRKVENLSTDYFGVKHPKWRNDFLLHSWVELRSYSFLLLYQITGHLN